MFVNNKMTVQGPRADVAVHAKGVVSNGRGGHESGHPNSRRARLASFSVLSALVIFGAMPSMAMAQPAPALTSLQVLGVASPKYLNGAQWDKIPAGGISTPHPHGGAWIKVAVFEQGYGTAEYSAFNGSAMTLYQSDPQVGADRKVYGYIRYYILNKNFSGGGRFTNQATSINTPIRTLSTMVNVQ